MPSVWNIFVIYVATFEAMYTTGLLNQIPQKHFEWNPSQQCRISYPLYALFHLLLLFLQFSFFSPFFWSRQNTRNVCPYPIVSNVIQHPLCNISYSNQNYTQVETTFHTFHFYVYTAAAIYLTFLYCGEKAEP